MSGGERVDVLHMTRVISRRCAVVTTTLCGRNRVVADGMNITSKPERVTCKLCRAALARAEPQS